MKKLLTMIGAAAVAVGAYAVGGYRVRPDYHSRLPQ